MALIDLIAQSGRQNFETLRRGWLPTTQEKAADDMAQLQVQAKKQAVAYEPERQQIARQKAKSELGYKKILSEKHKQEIANMTTTAEKTKRELLTQRTGRFLREAAKIGDIDKSKAFLIENRDKILPEDAEPEKIKAFSDVMNLDGDDFTKKMQSIRQGNEYIQKLNKEMFGKVVSYYNPNTKQLDEVAKDSPSYYEEVRKLKSEGFIATKKLGIDLKGEVSKLDTSRAKKLDSLKEERLDDEARTVNTLKGYKELINLVSKDTFRGGLTGDAIDGINDIYQQGQQLFGYGSIRDSGGNIQWNKIEGDKGVMAEIRKIAKTDIRYAGALMEMSYLKAKSLDKGGKVTDADFKFARKMISAGSDKSIIIQLLQDNISRTADQFNTTSDLYNRDYGNGDSVFKSINADKLLGFGQYDPSNIKEQQKQRSRKNIQDRKAALNKQEEAFNQKYPNFRPAQ